MKVPVYETVNALSLFMPSSELYTAQKDAKRESPITDVITRLCIFLLTRLIDDELWEGSKCMVVHMIP